MVLLLFCDDKCQNGLQHFLCICRDSRIGDQNVYIAPGSNFYQGSFGEFAAVGQYNLAMAAFQVGLLYSDLCYYMPDSNECEKYLD